MPAARPRCTASLLVLATVAAAVVHGAAGVRTRGAAAAKARAAQAVTPVEKVTHLLQDLQAQLEAESKAEATQYDKYACFCKEQLDEKSYQNETSVKKIAKLSANIGKLGSEIGELGTEISSLSQSIAGLEGEIKTATEKRAGEHEGYLAVDKDITEGIEILEGAIASMKDAKPEMTNAKLDLTQVGRLAGKMLGAGSRPSAAAASGPGMAAAAALAQLGRQAPGDSTVYEYHSNEIISMLEDLLVLFKKNKKETDVDEFKARSAFETRALDMKNQAAFQSKDKAEKEELSEAKTEEKSAAEVDRGQEQKELDADLSFLRVLQTECEGKAALWDQRSRTRANELTAIAQAIELLAAGVKPSWKANKKLVGLQTRAADAAAAARAAAAGAGARRAPAFLQLAGRRASGAGTRASGALAAEAAGQQAARLLSGASRRLRSRLLATTAVRVEAAEGLAADTAYDPFVKVRGIIKDLVSRLSADATAEQTQKGECDTAMKSGVEARDKAQGKIEKLEAQISRFEAEKAELTADVGTLSADIAAAQKGLLERSTLRGEESAENQKTEATADEGKKAAEYALAILKEFYEGAAGLVQTGYVPPDSDRQGKTVGDRAPEIFDAEYKGNQESSKGIIGILEVIVADFSRTTDTVAENEETAASDFSEFQTETESDISTKNGAVDTKQLRISELEDKLVGLEDSLRRQKRKLGLATDSLRGLEAACVDGEETYEGRAATRQKEVEALKEAHAILEDWQG